MALVAYDNSDSSDFEEDEDESKNTVTVTKKVQEPAVVSTEKVQAPSKLEHNVKPGPSLEGSKLFNLLPQPNTKKPQVIEEDDEFLHKKESSNAVKPKAKITVPSLSDFKDVESSVPMAKPRMGCGKKSGLLSMLPQPRNGVKTTANSFLPYALLTQKSTNTNVKKKDPLPIPIKKAKVDSKPLVNEYSDDSDNEGMENDFFSINKPTEIPVEHVPLEIDETVKPSKPINESKPFNIESYFKPDSVENHIEQSNVHIDNGMEYAEPSSSNNNGYGDNVSNSGEIVLDDEAILKLCGARGKRRREDIEIVDVNQQEILADAREMLLKGLMDDTTKRVSVSKKKGNEPTSQQKRKHQITYLAHQAKANEAELQNQWANNRMSKRQTQSKYGF